MVVAIARVYLAYIHAGGPHATGKKPRLRQVLAQLGFAWYLSTRTKIFLYVKILSSCIGSPPTLFPPLINKKDMLTEAIYSQCTPRNLPLAPENLSRESASSCSATCPWSF